MQDYGWDVHEILVCSTDQKRDSFLYYVLVTHLMQTGGSSHNGYKMLFNFTAKATWLKKPHRVGTPLSGSTEVVKTTWLN